MNISRFLISAATVALIAGTSVAVAQQQEQLRGAPAQSAPAQKMAPKSPAGEPANHSTPGSASQHGAADTNRNSSAEQREGGKPNRAGELQNGGRRETTGQAPQNENRSRRETTGQAPQNENRGRHETTGQALQNERRDSDRKEPSRATDEKTRDQNRATEERGRNNERDRSTVGQGAAPSKGPSSSLSVNITPEKRTRIHDVFIKERSAPRVDHVDFNLSVGTAVPRSVRIIAVPREIIEIEPQWRGYEYFMVGDQIVIVDPRSMEIVAVLEV